MRVLLIHNETCYFAGAQKMLAYFLAEIIQSNDEVILALAENSKMKEMVPKEVNIFPLSSNQPFSLPGLWNQLQELSTLHKTTPVDIIHAWTTRDWELASLTSYFLRRPSLGTLHDHPRANFISIARQRLMWSMARWGLRYVVCVSHAVRQACQEAGYPRTRLRVIHNGLCDPGCPSKRGHPIFRLGYLGVFSDRKGFSGLFKIIEELATMPLPPWEIWIAGGAQDEEGKILLQKIHRRYEKSEWWSRIQWVGWVKQPWEFLSSIDLLVVPSQEFDPFPTVLLEAGICGIPTVAAKVGGVAEIVEDRQTGWLFPRGDWHQAADLVSFVMRMPFQAPQTGARARNKVLKEFSVQKMVATYSDLYVHC